MIVCKTTTPPEIIRRRWFVSFKKFRLHPEFFWLYYREYAGDVEAEMDAAVRPVIAGLAYDNALGVGK